MFGLRGKASIVTPAAVAAAVVVAVASVSLIQSVSAEPAPDRSGFVPITPCRLFDTRPGDTNVGPRATPIGAGETFTIDVWGTTGNCSIPTTATAVTLNVVSIEPTASSFLTVFPAGAARPNASNLNWTPFQPPTPNAVTTALGDGGRMSVYNLSGTVHLAVDVVGWFEPMAVAQDGDPGAAGPQGAQGPPGPAGTSAIDPPTIVWVAPEGGDFTDVSDALDSITDNSASNPYLVRIAPGTYTETGPIDLKDHVDVQGSGPATVLMSATNDPAVQITGALHTELRDLKIVAGAVGVEVSDTTDAADVRLSGLEVTAGGGTFGRGIRLVDAVATVTDVDVSVAGSAIFNTAVEVSGGELTLRRAALYTESSIPSSPQCIGVGVIGATAHVADVVVTSGGCASSTKGVLMTASSDVDLARVEVMISHTAGGISVGYGISVNDSSLTVDDSSIGGVGKVTGLYVNGTSTVVARDTSLRAAGSDFSIWNIGSTVRAIDVVLDGLTSGMTGRCTNARTTELDPFTCT